MDFFSGVKIVPSQSLEREKLSARPLGEHITLLVKYNVLYFTKSFR